MKSLRLYRAPTALPAVRSNRSANRSIRATLASASILSAAILNSAPASAQCTGEWVRFPVSGPSARGGHAMVYDAARSVVLMVGGLDGSLTAINDTWIWNGSNWRRLDVAGPFPARQNSGIAYDAASNRVVLFGGGRNILCTESTRFFRDTWTWDGSNWTHEPFVGPSAREGATLGYDPTSARVVLFGGGYSCGIFPNDTWEWDGAVWAHREPTRLGRNESTAWTDSSGRVRFFGGYGFVGLVQGFQADMWEWTGNAWTEIPQSAPTPVGRFEHAVAYEPTIGRLLLFGGHNSGGQLSDSWLFDNTSWTQQLAGTPGPSARSGHAMAYDAAREQVVLFGGIDENGARIGDTWIWSVRPVVIASPDSEPACAGRSVNFSVTAGGVGPFTYQWRKAGVNLVDGAAVNGATTPQLTLHDVSPADGVAYDCIVSNGCGSTPSASAILRVSALMGDLNCDCQVDLSDLATLLANFGSTCP